MTEEDMQDRSGMLSEKFGSLQKLDRLDASHGSQPLHNASGEVVLECFSVRHTSDKGIEVGESTIKDETPVSEVAQSESIREESKLQSKVGSVRVS